MSTAAPKSAAAAAPCSEYSHSKRGFRTGECARPAIWHCPACNGNKCPSHAPKGVCDLCSSKCSRLAADL